MPASAISSACTPARLRPLPSNVADAAARMGRAARRSARTVSTAMPARCRRWGGGSELIVGARQERDPVAQRAGLRGVQRRYLVGAGRGVEDDARQAEQLL